MEVVASKGNLETWYQWNSGTSHAAQRRSSPRRDSRLGFYCHAHPLAVRPYGAALAVPPRLDAACGAACARDGGCAAAMLSPPCSRRPTPRRQRRRRTTSRSTSHCQQRGTWTWTCSRGGRRATITSPPTPQRAARRARLRWPRWRAPVPRASGVVGGRRAHVLQGGQAL
jgi:hypothetical protein